ncbi:glycosyltransferase [Hyphomicrobium sp.]|uniref:glycosyltransferase n=1 Tax=Hyphomicrobium sp. TaxID=82 RepID=UPI001D70B9EF|nr:glycosyltransferase [Hyphomicrobium sp.]MBY0558452.1 glycosyltransferase [Hyphomicrobium sp.]
MTSASGMSYLDALMPALIIGLLAAAILPWVNRNNTVVRTVAIVICVGLGWRYMTWRMFNTIPSVSNPVDFMVGFLFTAVEAITMVGATASQIFLTRTRNRTAEANRNVPKLLALPKLPKVDVLICTYNEDENILERTIIGTLAINYPNFRVWVCDDGRRPWLQALCERHNVGYLTRNDNAHAKAGNINAALKKLAALDEKPDFISILDADFVPLPEFLTRGLSLALDSTVGVVQTPQHFFNPDPIQSNLALTRVWPDEQRFFFDIVMASKDAWGAAFCCGTSSIIRFDALQSIGGFPTDSVTEDYLVSLRLREKGFGTVYLNEVLSLGLAPEGLAEYTGQRARWCLGFVQICRGPSGPLKIGNGLPFVDRIMLCETFLHWSATHLFRVLSVIVPALYLLLGIEAVHANVIDAIWYLAPFLAAQIGIFLWLTDGRVIPLMSDLYQMLCSTEVLKGVVSGLLRPKGQKFKVTAKGGDRSKQFIQWPLLRIFGVLLALTAIGIANAFLIDPSRPLAESSAIALFWSWYNIIVLTLCCYVCSEQQQRRNGERFDVRVPVTISAGGVSYEFYASDVSVSGIHLVGEPPLRIGSPVRVRFADVSIDACIRRKTEHGFGLEFENSAQSKAHLLRFIFSGRTSTSVGKIKPHLVATALAARILR